MYDQRVIKSSGTWWKWARHNELSRASNLKHMLRYREASDSKHMLRYRKACNLKHMLRDPRASNLKHMVSFWYNNRYESFFNFFWVDIKAAEVLLSRCVWVEGVMGFGNLFSIGMNNLMNKPFKQQRTIRRKMRLARAMRLLLDACWVANQEVSDFIRNLTAKDSLHARKASQWVHKMITQSHPERLRAIWMMEDVLSDWRPRGLPKAVIKNFANVQGRSSKVKGILKDRKHSELSAVIIWMNEAVK